MTRGPAGAELRRLRTYDELRACVELQQQTWGAGEVVPASLLVAGQEIGGVVGGAFDASGRLVGVVFGMTGVRAGEVVHWSHMLAVRDAWRDRGLGRQLKLFQRRQALEMGIDTMYWTYDPLEARNAHLNLNRLGAEIVEYACDVYGAGADNKLHSVIGTDRFSVVWHLDSARVHRALDGVQPPRSEEADRAPIVDARLATDGTISPAQKSLVGARHVRVEVPPDIQEVKLRSADDAVRWRQVTRRAFVHYLSRGYRVHGFRRDAETGRCFYVVTRAAGATGGPS
ncbi:MAG: GNAT family N-acetyltransferase [Candidatus Krumholzibacteriia bacterium]